MCLRDRDVDQRLSPGLPGQGDRVGADRQVRQAGALGGRAGQRHVQVGDAHELDLGLREHGGQPGPAHAARADDDHPERVRRAGLDRPEPHFSGPA
jgi:hypothetical protein